MSTLTDRLDSLWGTINQPENLTSLLESFTVWGLVVPVLVFVLTWIFKEPKAQKTSLALIALAALSPFAVPEPDATPLPGGAPWAYVALAALAGLTFLLGKGGKAGLWLTIMTLAGSLAVAALTLSLTLDPPVEPAPDTAPLPPAPDTLPEPMLDPAIEPTLDLTSPPDTGLPAPGQ